MREPRRFGLAVELQLASKIERHAGRPFGKQRLGSPHAEQNDILIMYAFKVSGIRDAYVGRSRASLRAKKPHHVKQRLVLC